MTVVIPVRHLLALFPISLSGDFSLEHTEMYRKVLPEQKYLQLSIGMSLNVCYAASTDGTTALTSTHTLRARMMIENHIMNQMFLQISIYLAI